MDTPPLRSLRQEMLARLRRGPATVRDLARESGLRDREAADHLAHALRSLGPGERLREEPATRLACGFAFRKRTTTTPGRCPLCSSEPHREAPVFWIEEAEGRLSGS